MFPCVSKKMYFGHLWLCYHKLLFSKSSSFIQPIRFEKLTYFCPDGKRVLKNCKYVLSSEKSVFKTNDNSRTT